MVSTRTFPGLMYATALFPDIAPTAKGLTEQKSFWVEMDSKSFIPGFADGEFGKAASGLAWLLGCHGVGASLAGQGTTEPFRSRMLDLDELNNLIGTPEMVALGEQYDTPVQPNDGRADVRR